MAREESNREDLLGEATALVERIEFVFPNAGTVVAGFRRDGAFSVFFGEEPAYHFNAAGELRRAYCDGLLIKAVGGRLVSLRRERTVGETQLVRHELDHAEQAAFMDRLVVELRALKVLLAEGQFSAKGQVPPESDVLGRVRQWLAWQAAWPVADRPNA